MLNLICDKKYMVLPVKHEAQMKKLKFYHEGELIYDLDIELDCEKPDVYYYVNIKRFYGMKLQVACNPEASFKIEKSDTLDDDGIYTDSVRPLFHFTCKKGWLNDPNGLVFYKGQYHMFYQHNPVACKWGNMHWGHATSKDLLHWKELDCALYPDKMGTMFSGSAIVDWNNVTGLKSSEDDVILLYYTAAGDTSATSKDQPFTQCMAYSTDGGKSFMKYEGNPRVPHIEAGNRDPKIIYHEQSDNYIMALYLDKNKYVLLSSRNLLDWQQIQELELEGDTECPDFYPLPVDGDMDNIKWIFSGAADRYMIGSFDGLSFKPETGSLRLHYGEHSYAAQSWSDIVSDHLRRLRIAWNTADIPSKLYNKLMTFPSELTLKTTDQGIRLFAEPVCEIERIYVNKESYTGKAMDMGSKVTSMLTGKAYDISLYMSDLRDPVFDISLFGLKISCDIQKNQLVCNGSTAPLTGMNRALELRFLIDTAGIELFIDGGQTYVSKGFLMEYNNNLLELEVLNGGAVLELLEIAQLENTWVE